MIKLLETKHHTYEVLYDEAKQEFIKEFKSKFCAMEFIEFLKSKLPICKRKQLPEKGDRL